MTAMTMAAMATTGMGAIFPHDNDAPHATPTTMTIPIPTLISKFLI